MRSHCVRRCVRIASGWFALLVPACVRTGLRLLPFGLIPGDFLIAARVMPAVICEVQELLQDVFDGTPLVAGPRPHKSLQGLEVGNQRTLCVVVAAQEPAEIGRAHVCTPGTTAPHVYRLLLEKK